MQYPVPNNEEQRLKVLRGLGVLYTSRNAAFDALCREAANRFDCPIALITLVDQDYQWFKAVCGLDVCGTPREHAFCTHAILSDQVMVVPDARSDARFRSNPLVTDPPNIVFYAGAPLLYGDGIRLGTLCVIDHKPRTMSAEDVYALGEIADRVSGELWALAFAQEEVA
ncbi:GAF domain-containing protein [Chthonobacter rhizosphaerae]|uniref:GAF domain-containing protein n=1 Tax=Chthonobacter rhizosphaerae TaxID=2735553 RepID=UPI0015EF2BDF|nr:GAF domain-containing protein [Chthonobacter rhizosphaerae]